MNKWNALENHFGYFTHNRSINDAKNKLKSLLMSFSFSFFFAFLFHFSARGSKIENFPR